MRCSTLPSPTLMYCTSTEQVVPTHKKIKFDEDESIMDLLSMVKTTISLLKTRTSKAASQSFARSCYQYNRQSDGDSQLSTITQLTEQVSILQLAHNKINSKLEKLTKFIMAQSATMTTPSPSEGSKEAWPTRNMTNFCS